MYSFFSLPLSLSLSINNSNKLYLCEYHNAFICITTYKEGKWELIQGPLSHHPCTLSIGQFWLMMQVLLLLLFGAAKLLIIR